MEDLLYNEYFEGFNSITYAGFIENEDAYNDFGFPLNNKNFISSDPEPFMLGGMFGPKFIVTGDVRNNLVDVIFEGEISGIMTVFDSDETFEITFNVSQEDLSCAGINQLVWKECVDRFGDEARDYFDQLYNIYWNSIKVNGTIKVCYKHTLETITDGTTSLTMNINTEAKAQEYGEYLYNFININITGKKHSFGLFSSPLTLNFNTPDEYGISNYLIIPKMHKIKNSFSNVEERFQSIFAANSISAILNRCVETCSFLVNEGGYNTYGEFLGYVDQNGISQGIEYKIIPYGSTFEDASINIYQPYFEQTSATDEPMYYSASNNTFKSVINDTITIYLDKESPSNEISNQKIHVYIFDEDEDNSSVNMEEFRSTSNVVTNFTPTPPSCLLYTNKTASTLYEKTNGLLSNIDFGFRNPSKEVSFIQSYETYTFNVSSASVTGTSNNFKISNILPTSPVALIRLDSMKGITINNMSFVCTFSGGGYLNTTSGQVSINGKTGSANVVLNVYQFAYGGKGEFLGSGSAEGEVYVQNGQATASNFEDLYLYDITGNRQVLIECELTITLDGVASKTLSGNTSNVNASIQGKTYIPGLFIPNLCDSQNCKINNREDYLIYPPICTIDISSATQPAQDGYDMLLTNTPFTKEAFSFTSYNHLLLDGIPRACNDTYYLSGNIILLPAYIKGENDFCLYIGARRITQRILDRCDSYYSGALTFTSDYSCAKSFYNKPWELYQHQDLYVEYPFDNKVVNYNRNLLRIQPSYSLGPGTSNYHYQAFQPSVGFKPNTTYTFSFANASISKTSTATANDKVFTIRVMDSAFTTDRCNRITIPVSGSNSKTYSFHTNASTTSTDYLLIYCGEPGYTNGWSLSLYRAKLEEGVNATTWNNAPETIDESNDIRLFKCADKLATMRDATESIASKYGIVFQANRVLTNSPSSWGEFYLPFDTYFNSYILPTNTSDSGYIGLSTYLGQNVSTRCLIITTGIKTKLPAALYSDAEYNIRVMTYPTFANATTTTVTNVSGVCINYIPEYKYRDCFLMIKSGNHEAFWTNNSTSTEQNISGGLSAYYHDGLLYENFSGTISGKLSKMSPLYADASKICAYDSWSASVGLTSIEELNKEYDEIVKAYFDTLSSAAIGLLPDASASIGYINSGYAGFIPTIEQINKQNITGRPSDITKYKLYGMIKFDFNKMLYYLDMSIYLKTTKPYVKFDKNSLIYQFNCSVSYKDASRPIVYPLSPASSSEVGEDTIQPTYNIQDDSVEMNFRIYETNKVPFNPIGHDMKFKFAFTVLNTLTNQSSTYTVTDINIPDILLQQGTTYQNSVFHYVPSSYAYEEMKKRTPTTSYGTRITGTFENGNSGLKMTYTGTDTSSVLCGVRWTGSSTNLSMLGDLSNITDGTSVICTSIVIPTTLNSSSKSIVPLNGYVNNSTIGFYAPLVGTLNIQNKPVARWYLMHSAVSNAPSGVCYNSVYDGTTSTITYSSINTYTSYLKTTPQYVYVGFRPGGVLGAQTVLNGYLVKYGDISYYTDMGYNNMFQ